MTLAEVFLVADKGFSHEVCGGSVRDEDEREIFLSKKAAIKRGQTRTRSQYAEHKQVRQCQACLQAGLLLIALRTR